jgi:Tfp pilus assembly protein PilN
VNVPANLQKLGAAASGLGASLRKGARAAWDVLMLNVADERVSRRRAVVVSIEKGRLEIVYGTRFLSRIRILGSRCVKLENGAFPDPETVASRLLPAMKEMRAGGADVTLVVPKAWTIMQEAEFPGTVRDNLAEVLSWEMDRLTPIRGDEAWYDYGVLSNGGPRLQLFLAAAKTDRIDSYVEALKRRRIRVERVTVGLWAMGTLSAWLCGKSAPVFLKICSDEYEGALVGDGMPRKIFVGRFANGDGQRKGEKVLADLEPLLDEMKNNNLSPVVVLAAGERAAQDIAGRVGVPVRVLGETDLGLKLPKGKRLKAFTALGGLLETLWPKARGLNLLTRGKRLIEKPPFVATVVLLAALALAGFLWFVTPLLVEERRIAEIDRQIALRKDEVKKVEALQKETAGIEKEIAAVHGLKEGRPRTMEVLGELTRILPKSAWLFRTRVTDTTVEIEGFAAAASDLLQKLEESELFRKVEFTSPTLRDTRLNADRFVIKMELETAVKEAGGKKP